MTAFMLILDDSGATIDVENSPLSYAPPNTQSITST